MEHPPPKPPHKRRPNSPRCVHLRHKHKEIDMHPTKPTKTTYGPGLGPSLKAKVGITGAPDAVGTWTAAIPGDDPPVSYNAQWGVDGTETVVSVPSNSTNDANGYGSDLDTAVNPTLTPGDHTITFAVQSVDAAGNVSEYVSSTPASITITIPNPPPPPPVPNPPQNVGLANSTSP